MGRDEGEVRERKIFTVYITLKICAVFTFSSLLKFDVNKTLLNLDFLYFILFYLMEEVKIKCTLCYVIYIQSTKQIQFDVVNKCLPHFHGVVFIQLRCSKDLGEVRCFLVILISAIYNIEQSIESLYVLQGVF